MRNMTDIIDKNSVAIVEGLNHDEVICKLLELLESSPKITDHLKLKELILERESIISTGIGAGLAIPHARRNIIKDFVASAVLIRGEGCDWNAMDNKLVNFAILIASPQDTHREYLGILSSIAVVWKEKEKREKIISTMTEEEFYNELASIKINMK